jgi:hypothetical protein
LHSSLGNS